MAEVGQLKVHNHLFNDPAGLRAEIAETGYLFLRGVLSQEIVSDLRSDMIEVLTAQGIVALDERLQPVWTGVGVDAICDTDFYSLKSIVALAESREVRDLFEKLVGTDVFVFKSTTVRYALPDHDLLTTPAHQDNYFIGPNADFYSMWIPLIPITPETGGLAVAVGSQRRGLVPHEEVSAQSYVYRGKNWIGVPLDQIREPWLTTDYFPGDILVFHSQTIHMALPNHGRQPRLSVDVRGQGVDLPRAWSSQRTILEVQAYRESITQQVELLGGDGEMSGRIFVEMMTRGLEADRANVAAVFAEIFRDTHTISLDGAGSQRPD